MGRAGAEVGPTVVEVWAVYGRRVLDLQHLRGVASDRYTIGESHAATLVVPPAGLPHGRAFELVRGRTLNFTESMRGEVSCEGTTLTLGALVHEGRAALRGSTYSYTLRAGTRCRIEHNAVTFFVNVVPREDPIRLDFQSSRRFWASNARALVLFASVLVPAYWATPAAGEADVELDGRPVEDMVFAFSREPVPDEPQSTPALGRLGDPPADGGSESPGQRQRQRQRQGQRQGQVNSGNGDSSGEWGGAGEGRGRGSGADPHQGEPSAPPTRGRRPDDGSGPGDASATRGADRAGGRGGEPSRWMRVDNSDLCPTLDLLAVEAKTYTRQSMLTRVGPCEPPENDAIPQRARNFDPDMQARQRGILGGMLNDDSFLASPYGRAFAVGDETEDIWGRLPDTADDDRFAGPRRGAPRVRQAKGQIKGRLDRDIIHRIVRAHINEVRHCYASGLTRRPKLRGRVAIRFTIQASGRVSTSRVSRSALGDERVEKCISAAARRWKFPRPQGGGEVVVNSPFVLDRG